MDTITKMRNVTYRYRYCQCKTKYERKTLAGGNVMWGLLMLVIWWSAWHFNYFSHKRGTRRHVKHENIQYLVLDMMIFWFTFGDFHLQLVSRLTHPQTLIKFYTILPFYIYFIFPIIWMCSVVNMYRKYNIY